MCCPVAIPLVPPKPLALFVAMVGLDGSAARDFLSLSVAEAAKPVMLGRRGVPHGWWPWFTQPRGSCQGSGVPQHAIV